MASSINYPTGGGNTRPASVRRGSIRRASGYMSGTFRTVEPAQVLAFHPDDFDPQELADLAGRQMLPLEPRDIPFQVMDSNGHTEMSSFPNIAAILRHRALNTSRNPAFAVCDPKGKELANLTWDKMNARAEKVAQVIREKSGLSHGDRVALIYRKSEILDFVAALFGCFLAGVVAVPINAAEEMAELSFILTSTGAWLALTTDHNLRAFTRDLEARRAEFPQNIEWWKTNEFGSWYPQRKGSTEYPPINPPDLAYVEYSKAPNGELKGVAISHRTIIAQCTTYKAAITIPSDKHASLQFSPALAEVALQSGGQVAQTYDYSADVVVSYIEPRQQVGLILGVLCGVFAGNFTVFVSSSVMDSPPVWVNLLTRYQATIALADYAALRATMFAYQKDPSAITNFQRKQPPDLSSLRYLLVDALLVDPHLSNDIAEKLLRPLGCDNPEKVISPLASLPEHGGMILAFRDYIGPARLEEVVGEVDESSKPAAAGEDIARSNTGSGSFGSEMHGSPGRPVSIRSVLAAGSSRDAWECLLDREALKRNKIIVLETGTSIQGKYDVSKVMKVGAFGFVMPEATIAIVDPETSALCPPDTVGEIWVDSPSLSGGFWALPKHTEAIFHAKPLLIPPDTLTPEPYDQEFLRTGLLGCVIGGRIIVFGLYEDRIRQQALGLSLGIDEFHYAPDLVKTIMNRVAVDTCTAFETFVNDEHLPVVVCESGLSKEELDKISDRIVECLLEEHGVRVYGVVVCPPGSLPRHFKNGRRVLHAMLCKKAFELGRLAPIHLRLDTDRTVFNVAWGDDLEGGIWKSGVAYENAWRRGDIPHGGAPQHTGMEQVAEVLDEQTGFDLTKFTNITDVLLWRTAIRPDDTAYYIMENRNREPKPVTWRKFNSKIATVANFLKAKGVKPTDHVLLIFPHGMDFIESVHACLVLGAVPIPVQQPETAFLKEDITNIISIVIDLRVSHIIVNTLTEETLKSKPAQMIIKQAFSGNSGSISKFPEIINVAKAPKFTKVLGKDSGFLINADWLDPKYTALILIYYTPDGRRYCVKMGHDTIVAQCRTQKVTCQMKSQRGLVSCMKSFSGLGFLQGVMAGVYVGCPTVLISPSDYYATPGMWFESIHRFKVKDAFATYSMMQHAMSNMTNSDYRSFVLHSVQNLMLATESRPKPELYHQILAYFLSNRLEKEAINTVYSHIMNPMITTRSYMLMEPIALYLELRSLRKGIVRIVTPEEDPTGVLLHDSGIVPTTTMIAIVNPETRTVCPNNVVGEIWVASDANVKSFYGSDDIMETARFAATIEGGDQRTVYARTGDLGFLWTVQRSADPMGHTVEEGQCLFVLGPIGETFEVNGLMHFPIDVELTIEKAHPMVTPEGCIIFQGVDNEIVAVVQIKSPDYALSLIPVIVSAVLDDHVFMVDVIVLVANGNLPKSRSGQKQRGKTLVAYLDGTLKTIHTRKITGNYAPLQVPFSEENTPVESESAMIS